MRKSGRSGILSIRNAIKRVSNSAEPAPTPASSMKIPQELLKKAKALAGYSGVYIAGPKKGWPITIGVSSEASNAYYSIQRGWWEEQVIHAFYLTPGPPTAARIKARLLKTFEPNKRFFNPSWFDVTKERAIEELQWAAEVDGIELFDEVEAERRYHMAVQKAIEAKAGVQRQMLVPDPARSGGFTQPAPPSVVVPLRPKS